MVQGIDVDYRAIADRLFSSWDVGWRSLLLRQVRSHPRVDEADIPPHSDQTIVLVTHGACEIESAPDGRWIGARNSVGSIGLHPPHRPIRLRWRAVSPEPHQVLQLYLPSSTIARVVEEQWDRDPVSLAIPDTLSTRDPLLERMMLGLLRAAKEGVGDFYAESAAVFLAVHTLTRHGGVPTPRHRAGDDQRIRRSQAFLRANLHLPLSLADTAAEACMSRYHFLRTFRAATGETPHRYLTRLRLECAQLELTRSADAVGEVAYRCGFSSPSHFAATFRRWTGHGPTDYRRRYRR